MKAKHRHELETNALAKRLAAGIEKSRPYGPTILGVLVAIVVCVMLLSYLNSASAERQSEAWSQYYAAMQTPGYNFDQMMTLLKQAAEEHPETAMQEWADVTWADGKLYMASQLYLQNRNASSDAMSQAFNTYNALLKTASDTRVIDRANLGLGRIYEMQDDLEKAKEHYALVGGGFAELAKTRVERLDDKSAREQLADTMSWLSKAPLPVRTAPAGPGTPGKQPLFAPGDLEMPAGQASGGETSATQSGGAGATTGSSGASLDELFQRFNAASKSDEANRYDASESAPAAGSSAEKPETGDSSTSKP
jgi:hypothetical protein